MHFRLAENWLEVALGLAQVQVADCSAQVPGGSCPGITAFIITAFVVIGCILEIGGPWDYKYIDENGRRRAEEFGNFHYGVIAAAMGMPCWFATCGAGLAHMKDNRGPDGSLADCGDDPRDQCWIKEGYRWYERCEQSMGARV